MNHQTIKRYFKDYDLKKYMKYVLSHPHIIMKKNVVQQSPPYLSLVQVDMESLMKVAKGKIKLLSIKQTYMNDNSEYSFIWNIHLAGVDIVIDKNVDWNQQFDDDEDMAALHRFIWMYNELIIRIENGYRRSELKKQVLEFILSWIQKYKIEDAEQVHSEIYQTYSVAERIVNWLYSLSILNDEDEFQNMCIYESIVKQVQYICNHLEYYGDYFTGNHLSNDGKAIYIAGMMLGIERYQKIGRKILQYELGRIFVDDGFLREGSVHYQYLITKNYTDVYWVAEQFEDTEFQEILKLHLFKMIQACRYFMIDKKNGQYEIPLIGDISPDYKPEWIIGVPQVAEWFLNHKCVDSFPYTIGYHSVFCHLGDYINSDVMAEMDIESNNICVKPRDWGKIKNNNWTLFTHVNNSLYPNNLTGHFHHDTGAIVLYYRNNCILCDCGRYTYKPILRGLRDKGMEAHCGVKIDNMQPEIDMRTFYSNAFIKKYASQKPCIIQANSRTIEIQQYGFQRLKNVGIVKRIIQIAEDIIEIKDVFEGRGKHNVKLFFHTKEKFLLENNNLIIVNNKQLFNMVFNNQFDNIKIVYGKTQKVDGKLANSYGKNEDICSAICEWCVDFPYTIITKIVVRR